MGNLTHTVSGDIASFRSAARVPIESLKCHFLPVQEGTGDPSPENVRPISGWNQITTYKSKKNLAHIIGWGAQTVDSITATRILSNSYGTILNTIDFIGETGELNIIQSQTAYPEQVNHYRNGYFAAVLDNLKFEKTYTVSFKISNIINNPLEASLSDLSIGNPYGNRYYTSQIINNRVIFHNYIFKQSSDRPGRTCIDVRNCGMSFTISEFMVTEEGISNEEWEPYCGDIIPITFPTTGKNILNPEDIYIYNEHFTLNNGVYTSTVTDTRTYTQLSVQLWKTRGSYLKTLYVDYLQTIGRHTLTFTVDDVQGQYLCLKHNGIKKDFILLFPVPLGLRQYTLSVDLLANDPTTVGGVQLTNIQLEVGDMATEYEAYRDNLDNTIYGGYVDIAKGEVVAEWISKSALWKDIRNNNPNINTGIESGFIYFDTPIVYTTAGANNTNSFCNVGKYAWAGTDYNMPHFYPGTRNGNTCSEIYLPSTVDENIIIQTVVKLQSSIHYPLSKTELKTFLDQNNIWSNTNDITEVSYQIHDSNMIKETKNLMAAANNSHYRKVVWNQWCYPLNADNWAGYTNDRVNVSFNDGIATSTWLTTDIGFSTSVRLNYNIAPSQITNDIWYGSYLVNPSKAGLKWGIEMCGGQQLTDDIVKPANEWSFCSFIAPVKRNNRNTIYISNVKTTNGADIGMTAQAKAPIHVNLTQMFGAGNEPTKAEFEHLCSLNNIDLTIYHPYNEGTEQYWIFP